MTRGAYRQRTPPAQRIRGRVEFKIVDFSYTPGKNRLKTCPLKSGQTIAIVGIQACRQNNPVNLLMRFYEIDGAV